jgi:N-acetylglucosaminyldiphosphoundecaprenol N-acetyl-beta-D-mannosaminyltransferase
MNVKISNCPVTLLSKKQIMDEMVRFLTTNTNSNYIIPINLTKLVLIQNDSKLAECIQNSALNIADGLSIVFAVRFARKIVIERFTGVKLMYNLLEMANMNGYRVYLLGSKPDILSKCVARVRKEYPNINIVGYHHGYYKAEKLEDIVDSIGSAKVDILFVGMGLPQKEYFIYDYYKKLHTKVILAVGGAFDIMAGKKKIAPSLIQKCGLEWLWRSLYDRTRTLLILRNLWAFFGILIKEIWQNRIRRGGIKI